MPPTRRVHALTYDELEALSRLQEHAPTPDIDDPAWSYLLALGLVWLDMSMQPATYRLTSAGRSYSTDYH